MASVLRRDSGVGPQPAADSGTTEAAYSRPDERAVLQALGLLVHECKRPVWALEVTRCLVPKQARGGPDGRWVAIALGRLAAQGKVIQVRRWKTGTSRWTLPAEQTPSVPRGEKWLELAVAPAAAPARPHSMTPDEHG